MRPQSREVPLTVVIVTFASQDVVGRTLSALASGHDSGLLDCLVVDNASPDRTREVITSDHPWVRMIASPKNLGYGRACNLGFNEVTTPYVLFMNPDVEIQPAGVARLLHHLEERPRAGIIAPATRIGGEYQSAGGLPTPWSIARKAMGGVGALAGAGPILPGMAPYSTDWLCGAVMLVRSAMFRAIGRIRSDVLPVFRRNRSVRQNASGRLRTVGDRRCGGRSHWRHELQEVGPGTPRWNLCGRALLREPVLLSEKTSWCSGGSGRRDD